MRKNLFQGLFLMATLGSLMLACAPDATPDDGLSNPVTRPPGYYPGRAGGVVSDHADEFRQWRERRKPEIDAVNTNIPLIRKSKALGGCIGQPPALCLATMAQGMAITSAFRTYPRPDGLTETDVMEVSALAPWVYKDPRHALGGIHFSLFLANGVVDRVRIMLARSPTSETNEKDKERGGLFESLSMILSRECPTLTAADTWRWYDETVRPRLAIMPGAAFPLGTVFPIQSAETMFCGRHVDFAVAMVESGGGGPHPSLNEVAVITIH